MIETKISQHECISIRSNQTVKSFTPTTVANRQIPSKITRDLSSHMTMDLCLEGNNIPRKRMKEAYIIAKRQVAATSASSSTNSFRLCKQPRR
jgi:hypothetical protein